MLCSFGRKNAGAEMRGVPIPKRKSNNNTKNGSDTVKLYRAIFCKIKRNRKT